MTWVPGISVLGVLSFSAQGLHLPAQGLFGALSSHNARWGFFGVSCFFEVCIGYGLLVPGIKYAFLRGKSIGIFYTGLALLLFVTWWGYPVVWGFAEGANFISVDAEVIACWPQIMLMRC